MTADPPPSYITATSAPSYTDAHDHGPDHASADEVQPPYDHSQTRPTVEKEKQSDSLARFTSAKSTGSNDNDNGVVSSGSSSSGGWLKRTINKATEKSEKRKEKEREQAERDKAMLAKVMEGLEKKKTAQQDALDAWVIRRATHGPTFTEPPPMPYWKGPDGTLRPRTLGHGYGRAMGIGAGMGIYGGMMSAGGGFVSCDSGGGGGGGGCGGGGGSC